MRGPDVRYDHFIPIWISERDLDEDVWPLHTKTCDAPKLVKDLGDIAHIKRIIKKSNPATRPKPKMRSGRKFPKAKTVWPKRKFGR